MTPEALAQAIKAAVSKLDKVRAKELCDGLIAGLPAQDEPFPVQPAKSILSSLRRKRYFDLMIEVADALISNGQEDAQIRRQYGQALIDSGKLNAALAFLTAIVEDPVSPPREVEEAWGLLGRVHKQSYVNQTQATAEKKQRMMDAALESYMRVYDLNREENRWHGINVVALLARADRDGVPVPIREDFRDIAQHLIDTIAELEDGGNATLWDYGTAMEAAVALGDVNVATGWAEKYVGKGPDAFELTSTLRQLEEVWRVTAQDEIGLDIVPLLKAALLAAEDGSVSVTVSDFSELKRTVSDKRLERVFGEDSYKRIKWLQLALDSCQAIGLVAKRDGTGVGTGFVVNGQSLSSRLDDGWYFLTNSHVITNDDEVIKHSPPNRKPLKPEQASITFELLFEQEPREFGVAELVWTSPPDELDATLLRLDKPFYDSGVETYQIASELPDPQERPRIYIAGHPGGRSLTISLHDNHLLEFNDRLMQYRTPTDPGSSGSPVFNDQWELVGLHHAGSFEKQRLNDPAEQHEANEGIRISAIINEI